MSERKKLIEVALPLEAINRESAREKPGRACLRLELVADRLARVLEAPRRDAGKHLLERQPGQRVAIGEVLVGGHGASCSPSAVRTRGRSTLTRRPPSVTSPASWP